MNVSSEFPSAFHLFYFFRCKIFPNGLPPTTTHLISLIRSIQCDLWSLKNYSNSMHVNTVSHINLKQRKQKNCNVVGLKYSYIVSSCVWSMHSVVTWREVMRKSERMKRTKIKKIICVHGTTMFCATYNCEQLILCASDWEIIQTFDKIVIIDTALTTMPNSLIGEHEVVVNWTEAAIIIFFFFSFLLCNI